MMEVEIILEETLKVKRHYKVKVEDETDIDTLVMKMEGDGFMGRPSDEIPFDKLITMTDETDYSSPESVYYEYFDAIVKGGNI